MPHANCRKLWFFLLWTSGLTIGTELRAQQQRDAKLQVTATVISSVQALLSTTLKVTFAQQISARVREVVLEVRTEGQSDGELWMSSTVSDQTVEIIGSSNQRLIVTAAGIRVGTLGMASTSTRALRILISSLRNGDDARALPPVSLVLVRAL
jgi:hypothetical protein